MSDPIIPLTRVCSKCNQEKPLTQTFFSRRADGKYGFNARCKECLREIRASEYSQERIKRYTAENKDQLRENLKRWRNKNRQYWKEYMHEWSKKNADHRRKYMRHWLEENRAVAQAKSHRRRARQMGLPDTLTAAQWQQAIEYFNGCCAVCNRQLRDLFKTHTVAADHWIPLFDPLCPGTIVENIVPLCHGVDGCNNRKGDREPSKWLISQFGKRKADIIQRRINKYFEWAIGQKNKP